MARGPPTPGANRRIAMSPIQKTGATSDTATRASTTRVASVPGRAAHSAPAASPATTPNAMPPASRETSAGSPSAITSVTGRSEIDGARPRSSSRNTRRRKSGSATTRGRSSPRKTSGRRPRSARWVSAVVATTTPSAVRARVIRNPMRLMVPGSVPAAPGAPSGSPNGGCAAPPALLSRRRVSGIGAEPWRGRAGGDHQMTNEPKARAAA